MDGGGLTKTLFRLVFEMVTGTTASHFAETDGRTDALIMRNLFEWHGIVPTEQQFTRAMEALPETLSSLAAQLRERGRALPGARNALAALSAEPAVVQTVLTGNVAANARLKLETFGLHAYLDLDIGAFGSDAEVRAALVGIAQQRAELKYGCPFPPEATVVIGDTVRDIEAGLSNGALTVGVASGKTTVAELCSAGAHAVLESLVDTRRVVDAVRGRVREL